MYAQVARKIKKIVERFCYLAMRENTSTSNYVWAYVEHALDKHNLTPIIDKLKNNQFVSEGELREMENGLNELANFFEEDAEDKWSIALLTYGDVNRLSGVVADIKLVG